MRYAWIALGIAALHRVLVYGVALLGFGVAMTAFNSSSTAALANPLFFLTGLIDFPATILGWLSFAITQRKIPLSDGALGFAAASFSVPLFWRIVCSLGIGTAFSVFLFKRDRKKRGRRPPEFWKSGL